MTSPRTLSADSADRIETALDALGTEQGPGFASLVVLDGEVAHRSCRGLANLEYGVPITTTTTFHIASMSKQFAGFALATVADRGLLDLDGDIREHLAFVPDLGARITPRQLAHHTSGLRDQWGELVLCGWRMDDVITTDDILRLVRRMESLNFAPQTGFSYSNTGYTLMAELVRAVDGRSLREFCAQELFEPLGMADTHFHDSHTELVPGRAYSYLPTAEGGHTHAVLSYANVGATSLHTTVEDLVRWGQNFVDRKVGSDAVFALMDESGVLADGTVTGYAFGLMHDTYRGERRVHHAGGDAGFRSQGERFPELGLSVYVLCNNGALDSVGIARQITDVVMDQLDVPPAPSADGPVQDPARYAGQFINPQTGYTVALSHKDDALLLMGAPLTQREPDVLTLRSSMTLRFSDDADAVDITMTAMEPQRMRRFEPLTPSAEELAELVGTYWSEELQTRYVVETVDGSFVLTQREHGSMPLTPTTKDCFLVTTPGFLAMAVAVAFDRDSQGAVTGFRLSMPRTSNIEVKRTAAPAE
jgi:CubicO group peptidase (beta-lactamase class C family)